MKITIYINYVLIYMLEDDDLEALRCELEVHGMSDQEIDNRLYRYGRLRKGGDGFEATVW